MNLILDTQQLYRNLAQKGKFTDEQAEVLTDALRDVVTHNIENLVTKEDLRVSVDQLRSEINSGFAGFESAMKIMKRDLMIFTGAVIAAGVTFLAALMQLLG